MFGNVCKNLIYLIFANSLPHEFKVIAYTLGASFVPI